MLYVWILFNIFALGMLVLDIRVVHRPGQVVGFREALRWTALYVALAAIFASILYFWMGHQSALEFVTGYVLELSLSADNLFVFLLIFNYFAVPEGQQHRVLFWGVIGALIFRGVFIGAGVGLIYRFHWIIYIFGGFLIYSGIRFAFSGNRKIDPSSNPIVKAVRRLIPVTSEYHGGKFFIRDEVKKTLCATPLLVVLVMIETSDVLFAVDSVPAVLAITLNGFIVYTANVFAILGLRSLYFAVSRLMKIFRFLHYGMDLVLVLVGLEMVTSRHFHIPTWITLATVAGALLISVALSIAFPEADKK